MRKKVNKNEIKEIQLDILQSIHQFCVERNLRYSLAFGTLLGAIRHKGYIPWDDDLDIMMPRPDYERFVSEYQGYQKHYVVQTYTNDKSYFLSLAKVYDNRTEQIIFPTKTGVFVDVFPIDGLPNTEKEAEQYINKYCKFIFHNILYTCKNNAYRPGNKLFNSIKYIGKRVLYPSRQKGIKKLDALINSWPYETSSHAGFVLVETGMQGYLNKEIFEHRVLVPFENKDYYAITGYDTFLKQRYGDYIQLPPDNERVPGHAAPVYWTEDKNAGNLT